MTIAVWIDLAMLVVTVLIAIFAGRALHTWRSQVTTDLARKVAVAAYNVRERLYQISEQIAFLYPHYEPRRENEPSTVLSDYERALEQSTNELLDAETTLAQFVPEGMVLWKEAEIKMVTSLIEVSREMRKSVRLFIGFHYSYIRKEIDNEMAARLIADCKEKLVDTELVDNAYRELIRNLMSRVQGVRFGEAVLRQLLP